MLKQHRAKQMITVMLALFILVQPLNGAIHIQGASAGIDATFAVEWMRQIYALVKADKVDAPGASRVYAYAGVTLYQSVSQGIPGDVDLSTQIKGMPALPAIDSTATYDWPSVADAAMQTVSDSLLTSDASHKATADLITKHSAARTAQAGAAVVQRSLAYGTEIGKAIADWASKDGATEARSKAKTYQLPTDSEFDYVPTTPGTVPVGPYWGDLRPFGLEDNNICDVPMPIQLSHDADSDMYKQALEVKDVGDHLTVDQKAMADWWVDTPGLTGAPSGHWMEIANQMVEQLNLKLDRAAEMYAMVGMALGDAFISCWKTKYAHPYLRPITYINRYIDPRWHSYIATPPFPTYDSGHSVASAAAADVLTALFGDVAFKDSTHVKEGQTARSFKSFQEAANEAAISRLYGGIHFRMDIDGGLTQGKCVAKHLLNNIHLHSDSN